MAQTPALSVRVHNNIRLAMADSSVVMLGIAVLGLVWVLFECAPYAFGRHH